MGVYVHGYHLFGWTDGVKLRGKQTFHVATEFYHRNLIPLCPGESYLILDFVNKGNGLNRIAVVQIPTCCKSIQLTYLRTFFWVMLIVSAILLMFASGIYGLDNNIEYHWSMALAFGISLFVAPIVQWLGYFNYASYDRAIELLSFIDADEAALADLKNLIDQEYGIVEGHCNNDVDRNTEAECLSRQSLPTARAELIGFAMRIRPTNDSDHLEFDDNCRREQILHDETNIHSNDIEMQGSLPIVARAELVANCPLPQSHRREMLENDSTDQKDSAKEFKEKAKNVGTNEVKNHDNSFNSRAPQSRRLKKQRSLV